MDSKRLKSRLEPYSLDMEREKLICNLTCCCVRASDFTGATTLTDAALRSDRAEDLNQQKGKCYAVLANVQCNGSCDSQSRCDTDCGGPTVSTLVTWEATDVMMMGRSQTNRFLSRANCGLLLFFSCENRTWLACGTVDLLSTSLQSAGEETQNQGRCGHYAKHSGSERGNGSTSSVGVGGDSERVLVETLCNREIYQKQDTPNSEYNITLM